MHKSLPAHNKHNWLIVAAITLLFIISQTHLALMFAPLEPNFLKLQLAFGAETFSEVLQHWGTDGVALFLSHFPFDFVHVFIYGAFGYLWATRTELFAGLSTALAQFARWSLPAAAVLDTVENLLDMHLIELVQGAPAAQIVPVMQENTALVALAATCATAKWILAALFALLFAWRLWRSVKAGKPSNNRN